MAVSSTPLQLFKRGFDYVEIANMLQTTEAEIEKQIHADREIETKAGRMRVYRRDYMRRQRAEARA